VEKEHSIYDNFNLKTHAYGHISNVLLLIFFAIKRNTWRYQRGNQNP